MYIVVLTLASHSHRNVNIDPQFAVSEEQIQLVITGLKRGDKMHCCSSHLLKSLSTSYSYFIHVSLYTKNSRKARIAMRVKAISDTGEKFHNE